MTTVQFEFNLVASQDVLFVLFGYIAIPITRYFQKSIADGTPTIDLVDGKSHERELALHALAKGESYEHNYGSRDLRFFVKTELITSPQALPPPYTHSPLYPPHTHPL